MAQVTKHTKSFAEVQEESEREYHEHRNNTPEGFVSTLPEMEYFDLQQNDFTRLIHIWESWSPFYKDEFVKQYGDMAYLLFTEVDVNVIRAAIQFWDPSYKCFSLGQQDLMPTLEEYTSILRPPMTESYRIFTKGQKKETISQILRRTTGIETLNPSAYQKTKGNNGCIRADFLLDILEKNPPQASALNTFALAMYGTVIFPKVLGHLESRVIELFSRLKHDTNHVPAILAETFRSLNFCRQKGNGRFTGCLAVLYIWFREHTRKHKSNRVGFYYFRPIEEFNKKPAPEKQKKKQWIQTFLAFEEKDVVWTASWTSSDTMLYKCGNRPWVPLPGLWGAVSYAPLQVRRQFGSEQFIPATHGMRSYDFSYEPDTFEARAKEITRYWDTRYYSHRGSFLEEATTSYLGWFGSKARDIRLPGRDSSIPHASWFPQIKPPTEIELAEQRFGEEIAAWETEKSKLMDKMMDLEVDIYKKGERIREVENNMEATEGLLRDANMDPKKRRRMDEMAQERQWKYSFTSEMEDLQDENAKLKGRLKDCRIWHKSEKNRAAHELREAYEEIKKLKDTTQKAIDRYRECRTDRDKKSKETCDLLQQEKSRNEELYLANHKLQYENEQLRGQASNERLKQKYEQVVRANRLLRAEIEQTREEVERWHQNFIQSEQRWEEERRNGLIWAERCQKAEVSNHQRQMYMDQIRKDLKRAVNDARDMLMEIDQLTSSPRFIVTTNPCAELLEKVRGHYQHVVKFATRVRVEYRMWLLQARAPTDEDRDAICYWNIEELD